MLSDVDWSKRSCQSLHFMFLSAHAGRSNKHKSSVALSVLQSKVTDIGYFLGMILFLNKISTSLRRTSLKLGGHGYLKAHELHLFGKSSVDKDCLLQHEDLLDYYFSNDRGQQLEKLD